MKIGYVLPERGLMYPLMFCTVCDQPIHDARKAAIYWLVYGNDFGDEVYTDRVFIAHIGRCCRALDAQIAASKDPRRLVMWEYLYVGLTQMMYNSGLKKAALKAHEIITSEPKANEVAKSTGLSRRFAILKRDNYRCQICGRTAAEGARLEVDHKTPRAKGGQDTEDNLWTLCFECNRGKRDTLL